MDEDSFYEAINNKIRRDIIKLLYERLDLSYTEILEYLKVSRGLLNFHLKKLDGLVEKTDRGTYKLTEAGRAAYRILQAVEKELNIKESPVVRLTPGLVFRRFIASVIDVGAVFLATGALFDLEFWRSLVSIFAHMYELVNLHPWIFHGEDLVVISTLLYRLVSSYSHVFFATYIILTLLEAFRGETPGKRLMGLRVYKRTRRRLDLVESGIRNAGKLFMLPLDLLLGVLVWRKGYLRYTDYYVEAVVYYRS